MGGDKEDETNDDAATSNCSLDDNSRWGNNQGRGEGGDKPIFLVPLGLGAFQFEFHLCLVSCSIRVP